MIYLDSSVALAELLKEPRRRSELFWRQALISSKLLEYEIWNRVHAYGLSGSHGAQTGLLVARAVLIDLNDATLSRALEPLPIAVRTLDALHWRRWNLSAGRANQPNWPAMTTGCSPGRRLSGLPWRNCSTATVSASRVDPATRRPYLRRQ